MNGAQLDAITPVERAVILALAQGLTLGEIAAARGCAYETIRKHVENLRAKLHVHRNAGVVGLAVARGIIAADDIREGVQG